MCADEHYTTEPQIEHQSQNFSLVGQQSLLVKSKMNSTGAFSSVAVQVPGTLDTIAEPVAQSSELSKHSLFLPLTVVGPVDHFPGCLDVLPVGLPQTRFPPGLLIMQ